MVDVVAEVIMEAMILTGIVVMMVMMLLLLTKG